MSVLPSLITSLLAVFPHPFQYLMMHQLDRSPGLGEKGQQQQSNLDLPLHVVVKRYKRKTEQERADKRAVKSAKNSAWRRTHSSDKAVK